MAKNILRIHDGELRVNSIKDRGTTVEIIIPITKNPYG